jgi:predicted dehydrogenase
MFAENSEMQEELCVVGDKGKIETGVPADASGKNSSELRIGLRDSENAIKKIVEVDKKILSAGQHHGSTYYQHLEFIKSINNNLKPQVSINDGLHAVAIGEAAEKSIKENRVVKMSEFNL